MRSPTKVGTLSTLTNDVELTTTAIHYHKIIQAAYRHTCSHQRRICIYSNLCFRPRPQAGVYAIASRNLTDHFPPLLALSFALDNTHHAIRRKCCHLEEVIA